jgi:hypothetical protein
VKYLLVPLEDIEHNPILKEHVERSAGFVDFIMQNYYIHAADKHCTWIALQLHNPVYVTINIEIS